MRLDWREMHRDAFITKHRRSKMQLDVCHSPTSKPERPETVASEAETTREQKHEGR